MTVAAQRGLDILLTIDKNIHQQQAISKYYLIVAIVDTSSSKLEILVKFIPSFEEQVPSFEKGKVYIISL